MSENTGKILQYQGPFNINDTIDIPSGYYQIGVSISQDDFMSWNSPPSGGRDEEDSFYFKINNNNIYLGKTYMYETDNAVQLESKGSISFPQGAPASTKIEIVYCES